MKTPKYLVVKFYDNDFGNPIIATLRRLWGWINENNAHLSGIGDYFTIPQMYQRLHDSGALETMIHRLFVLENLCYEIEFSTRGLYYGSTNGLNLDNPGHLEPNTHLSCEVSLHETQDTIKDLEWANGECALLKLGTGSIKIF